MELPPWLNTSPGDFAAANARGFAQGASIPMPDVAQIQLEKRRLNDAQAQEKMRLQAQVAESERQSQLEKTRMAVESSQRQQQLDIATQTAARTFQAQRAYQRAIESGVPPEQAMMAYGPSMGESAAGYGSLALEQLRARQMNQAPQPVQGPDGQLMGFMSNGRMIPLPRQQQRNDFTTVTQKIKGRPPTAGTPFIPAYRGLDFWNDAPAQAAVPGIPGTPDTTISRRIPAGAPLPDDEQSTNTASANDPLGLFSQ